MRNRLWGLCVSVIVLLAAAVLLADELEMTDGRKLVGKVLQREGDYVKFRVVFPGGGSAETSVPVREIKSIKEGPLPEPAQPPKVEPPKVEPPKVEPPKVEPPKVEPPKVAPPAPGARPQAEVEAEIDRLGKTPPDWWDSVKLNYPNSLDLSWPDNPPGGWNPNKNISQYFFGVINYNHGQWKEGCKFAHHLLQYHKDNRAIQRKAMLQLGHMYGTLLQDPARAAFWLRKADQIAPLSWYENIRLAECYWKLGSRQMALDCLNRQQTFSTNTIKLLGEMGELTKALDFAKRLAGTDPEGAYLAAGDACRVNGDYKQALDYYQKVQEVKPSDPKRAGRVDRHKKRATASAEAVRLFEMLDLSKIPDGTYRGECYGYASTIKLDVTVRSGRIEAIKIVEQQEKQYFTALVDPVRQIIAKQSVKGIDTTTGATLTAEGVINATAKALGSAMKK